MTFVFNRVTFDDQFQKLLATRQWLDSIGVQTQNTRFDEVLRLNKEIVEHHKNKLVEMVTEKMADLHASNLIIGGFTLNNILLGANGVKFTDLRRLRVSRKRAFVIDEFKAMLQYLFAIGVAGKEDVYASIAYYATKNEDSCGEWYLERTGKKAADTLDIARKMEEEVYS